jgi:sulfite reductase (ferredoxin)
MAGYAVPHFQVVLGGEWENNGGSYGLPVVAVPSKNIPDVVARLSDRYVANRKKDESFKDFVKRIGKMEIKALLEDLTRLPTDDTDRTFFSDWGDPREYSLGDMGVGECAGEVVSAVEFDLAAAEREVFEAQLELEKGRIEPAARTAYLAMLHAAKALVKLEFRDISDDPEQIIREFTIRFYDTQKFYDAFAGGKFAQFLFAAHQASAKPTDPDSARFLIDEAQLFIDASHACYNRMGTVGVA